jgi:hypothetical protein
MVYEREQCGPNLSRLDQSACREEVQKPGMNFIRVWKITPFPVNQSQENFRAYGQRVIRAEKALAQFENATSQTLSLIELRNISVYSGQRGHRLEHQGIVFPQHGSLALYGLRKYSLRLDEFAPKKFISPKSNLDPEG